MQQTELAARDYRVLSAFAAGRSLNPIAADAGPGWHSPAPGVRVAGRAALPDRPIKRAENHINVAGDLRRVVCEEYG